jgi:very-short-patch-repair endonuclease
MVKDFWESKLVAKRGHLKYLEELRILSRKNRIKSTGTENIVWYEILNNRKTGFKFLRQKPIYKFILDFYCRDLLMVIEIDGGYHNKRKWIDIERDNFMKSLNIETLRISNDEVLGDLEKTKNKITNFIEERKVSLFKGNVTK